MFPFVAVDQEQPAEVEALETAVECDLPRPDDHAETQGPLAQECDAIESFDGTGKIGCLRPPGEGLEVLTRGGHEAPPAGPGVLHDDPIVHVEFSDRVTWENLRTVWQLELLPVIGREARPEDSIRRPRYWRSAPLPGSEALPQPPDHK